MNPRAAPCGGPLFLPGPPAVFPVIILAQINGPHCNLRPSYDPLAHLGPANSGRPACFASPLISINSAQE